MVDKRRTQRTARGVIAITVLAMAGCGGGSSSAKSASAAAPSTSIGPTTASTTSTTATASGPLAPRILDAIRTAPYDPSATSNSKSAEIARAAVAKVVPDRKFSDLDFQRATPSLISMNDSFLFSKNAPNFDEVMTVVFIDENNKCAAVAAVIPETASHKASDAKVPTKFVALDVGSLERCSASDAVDTYKS